jgi:hypothetical protein
MMMLARLRGALLLLAACLVCAVPSVASEAAGERETEFLALDRLAQALRQYGGAARIYYQGSCPRETYRGMLPQIEVAPPPPDKTGLAAIRQMLRGNRHITVGERSPRIITINVGPVPNALLATRISRLSFTTDAQYNVVNAVLAIKRNPDFVAAMTRQGLTSRPKSILHAVVQPDPTLRHLAPAMTNVTVDEALDAVARTFRTILLFGFCSEESQIDIFNYYIYESAEEVPQDVAP